MATLGGRCLFTKSTVSPDHVIKLLFFIVFFHVEGTGAKQAACRYLTKIWCVCFFLIIIAILCSLSNFVVVKAEFFFILLELPIDKMRAFFH